MSGLISRLSSSSTGSSGGTLPPQVPNFSLLDNSSVKFVQTPSFEKINSSLTNTGISNLAVINGRVELYNTTGKVVPRSLVGKNSSQGNSSNSAASSGKNSGDMISSNKKGNKTVKEGGGGSPRLTLNKPVEDSSAPAITGGRSPGTPSFDQWQKVESPRHSLTSDSPSPRITHTRKDNQKENKKSKSSSTGHSGNKELFPLRFPSSNSSDGTLPPKLHSHMSTNSNSMDLADTYNVPARIRSCSIDEVSPRYRMGGAGRQDFNMGPSSSSSGINAPGYSRERSTSMCEFSETHAKKLLIDFQAVLNECFSDYDFRTTKVDQFKDCELHLVVNTVNERLRSLTNIEDERFLISMWEAIDQEIDLKQCQIFTYLPDYSGDIFSEEGSLWSFNFFFFNPKFKKVCFFYCIASSNMSSTVDSDLNDSGLSTYEEEDDTYSQSDVSDRGDTSYDRLT